MKASLRNTFFLLFALNIGFVSLVTAQEQRIAYVNTDEILSKMPEYQGLEQQLSKISQEWKNQLDEMQREIDRLKEEFNSKEILFTEEVRKKRKQEIQQKIEQRKTYLEQKFGPEGEYFQKQQELLKPIQQKVFQAINNVAQREGFDFVFDKASGSPSILFSRRQWNLNDEVLAELGIENQ